ncbi:MAG: hypothetical protein SOZ02_06255 [Hallerella porci]|uniref:hypothetical protein n=1 Tax=Hallerella TaxID=2815788 RepID=UPI001563EB44|nr:MULTISPECIES: hypothetical protein [Hallerella]MCI5601422.1 hypothetical protein [Hallerella sp.]MDY3921751.1 hypothetical protein [Hallerella porci]
MTHSIRILFLALAAFFCFLASYLFVQTFPFYKSIGGDEDIFYGKISSVSLVRGWSGSHVPLLDKTFFNLNGDKNAVFMLALPGSEKNLLKQWITFWSETGMPAPIEVRGVRISDSEWVVTGIAGNDGTLASEEIRDFHLRSLFWAAIFDCGLLFLAFLALRRALRHRR